jgi:hypothetical protein
MTEPTTPGLGRVFVRHDDRSVDFGVRPLLARVSVVRKPTFWPLPDGPYPLSQRREGNCTGMGISHELAVGPVMVPGIDDAYARERYRRNREEDQRMGNTFTEGATILATMKAAKKDGLITGYRWAFGVDDVVDTLCSVGPVILGIRWHQGMYRTNPLGLVRVTGPVVGGHCLACVGYDEHPVWGPCVLWLNSWGREYGIAEPRLNATGGVGWVPLDTLSGLLKGTRVDGSAQDPGESVVPADYLPAAAGTAGPSWWDRLRKRMGRA